jgi:hypothetical protein
MSEVRNPRASLAGWWIAAIVAVFALIGLIAIFTAENRHVEQEAARERAADAQQTATLSADAATVAAQNAALQASRAAQSAVESTADASQHAADAAGAAAEQTVQSAQAAGDAARDAAATEASPAE